MFTPPSFCLPSHLDLLPFCLSLEEKNRLQRDDNKISKIKDKAKTIMSKLDKTSYIVANSFCSRDGYVL